MGRAAASAFACYVPFRCMTPPCACRHKIELFGELADEAAAKLRKGQQIALHGRLRVCSAALMRTPNIGKLPLSHSGDEMCPCRLSSGQSLTPERRRTSMVARSAGLCSPV